MIHVIGYGNPGRGDDGLGPALARRIAAMDMPGVCVAIDYQLTVDHAQLIRNAEWALFVDASIASDAPFHVSEVAPDHAHDLASHSLTPGAVLALCHSLFGAFPRAMTVAISGQEFGKMQDGLGEMAKYNLERAEDWLLEWLRSPASQKVCACRSISISDADRRDRRSCISSKSRGSLR